MQFAPKYIKTPDGYIELPDDAKERKEVIASAMDACDKGCSAALAKIRLKYFGCIK